MCTRNLIAMILVISFLSAAPLNLCGQEDEYGPYKPEEFPEWAHSLRRFETVFFGSLPFAFLFTSLGFDMYAYSDSGFRQEYLPLFLGSSPEKEEFTHDTMVPRIGISISLSLVLAVIDLIIDKTKDAKK